MTSEEIRSAYLQLARSLSESGLRWVVEQVEDTIRAGHPVEKPTRIFKEDNPEGESMFGALYGSRRLGKPTAMMTLEPWSAVDELLFLINGVREAVVHAAELESEQLRLLRTIADVESVSFEPDAENSGRAALRLRGIRDERILALNKLLNELEREVRA